MSNDETQPVSGSRWEQQPDQPTTPAPAAVPAYAPAPAPRTGNRSKLLLASGAVGIALVAGAGGFALGHASADDDRDGPARQGFMPGGRPQGTFPGQGQPPGAFPDDDGDGDGRDAPDDDQGLPDDSTDQDSPDT